MSVNEEKKMDVEVKAEGTQAALEVKSEAKQKDYFKVVDTVVNKSSEVEADKLLSVFGKYKGLVFVTAIGYLALSVFVGEFFAKLLLVSSMIVAITNIIFNTFGGRDSANQAIGSAVGKVAEAMKKKKVEAKAEPKVEAKVESKV